ncbi:hypothetical protein E2320_003018 [Naja naja]|nr:hypothetical protein E2320_003018 [Naja naja]
MIILFLFLSDMVWKCEMRNCIIDDPVPVSHNYFQSGEFIIGAITSLMFMPTELENFLEDPHLSFIGEVIPLLFPSVLRVASLVFSKESRRESHFVAMIAFHALKRKFQSKRICMFVQNVQRINIQAKRGIHVLPRKYLSYPMKNQ